MFTRCKSSYSIVIRILFKNSIAQAVSGSSSQFIDLCRRHRQTAVYFNCNISRVIHCSAKFTALTCKIFFGNFSIHSYFRNITSSKRTHSAGGQLIGYRFVLTDFYCNISRKTSERFVIILLHSWKHFWCGGSNIILSTNSLHISEIIIKIPVGKTASWENILKWLNIRHTAFEHGPTGINSSGNIFRTLHTTFNLERSNPYFFEFRQFLNNWHIL